jgi:hypothetical protein
MGQNNTGSAERALTPKPPEGGFNSQYILTPEMNSGLAAMRG